MPYPLYLAIFTKFHYQSPARVPHMPRSASHTIFAHLVPHAYGSSGRLARTIGLTAGEGLGAAIVALAAILCTPVAGAAELGDITVQSYIGQPLVADIELNSLDADDKNSLQVRPAPVDVYQLANVTMNPALKNASVAVVRRNQRLYVHVASQRPIEAGYVHLFLELVSAKGSEVRTTTVWLAPNPLPPAPLPTPAPLAMALAQKPAPAVALPAKLVTARPEPALKTESEPRAKAELKPALKLAASTVPRAEAGTAPKTEYKTEPEHKTEPKPDAHAPTGKLAEVRRAAVLPAPLHPAQAASPKPALSCPSPDAGADKECTALDRKNAALTAKLVELEGKIQALQKALAPEAAGGVATAPVDATHATKAAPAPVSKLAQAPKVAPEPKAVTPKAPVAGEPKAASAEPLAMLVPKPSGPQPLVQLKPKALVPLTPLKPLKPAPPPEQAEGASPRLLLGGGTALFLLLIGTCVHFYSRYRKKAAQVSQPRTAAQRDEDAGQGEPDV